MCLKTELWKLNCYGVFEFGFQQTLTLSLFDKHDLLDKIWGAPLACIKGLPKRGLKTELALLSEN